MRSHCRHSDRLIVSTAGGVSCIDAGFTLIRGGIFRTFGKICHRRTLGIGIIQNTGIVDMVNRIFIPEITRLDTGKFPKGGFQAKCGGIVAAKGGLQVIGERQLDQVEKCIGVAGINSGAGRAIYRTLGALSTLAVMVTIDYSTPRSAQSLSN